MGMWMSLKMSNFITEENFGCWAKAARIEHQTSKECVQQEQNGWLLDQDKCRLNLSILQDKIDQIEKKVIPQLPLICKKFGNNPTVKKPFLATGGWAAATIRWLGEEVDSLSKGVEVLGSFSRVEFPKISMSSDAEIKPFLLGLGWQPNEWNKSKKTGQTTTPKFDEESLELIESNVGILISKHWKCRHRHSQITGWLRDVREDGRLEARVNPQGCPTVRMKHSQIVNVPSPEKKRFFAQEMRECFIAKPGYSIVGADAASCQLRMLCHYMGDDDYTRAVIAGSSDDGTDVHSVNMRATGLPNRGLSKNFIYGFLFGAGATKVGRLINKDSRAGKKIMDKFLATLPKLGTLRINLLKELKAKGYITAIDGRKLFVRSNHMALCYLLQGGEAILMKVAICYANKWIRQEGLDAKQIGVMHDEYSFEVLDEHTVRVAFLLEEAIKQAGLLLGLKVPMAGKAAIGKNWFEVH